MAQAKHARAVETGGPRSLRRKRPVERIYPSRRAYTLVQSRRALGISTRDYLIDVLDKLEGGWPLRRIGDAHPRPLGPGPPSHQRAARTAAGPTTASLRTLTPLPQRCIQVFRKGLLPTGSFLAGWVASGESLGGDRGVAPARCASEGQPERPLLPLRATPL
jgi:hypothetical protein